LEYRPKLRRDKPATCLVQQYRALTSARAETPSEGAISLKHFPIRKLHCALATDREKQARRANDYLINVSYRLTISPAIKGYSSALAKAPVPSSMAVSPENASVPCPSRDHEATSVYNLY
jgi:hypothetical protein